jgi:hypothetical protein
MKKSSQRDSYSILCRFCEHPNDVYRMKCKICGRNLNARMGVIDRRSDLDLDEIPTHKASGRKQLATRRDDQPRRRSPRVSVTLFPCTLSVLSGKNRGCDEHHSTILDITTKGLMAKTRMDLSLGSLLKIEFELPEVAQPITMNGKLIRKFALEKDPGFLGVVLLFTEDNQKNHGRIDNFVKSFVVAESLELMPSASR